MTRSEVALAMTQEQHRVLETHLFPGDRNEAVALVLCGRARPRRGRQRLLVHEIVPIPHGRCSIRTPDRVTWPTDPYLPDMLAKAIDKNMAILKVHSHPGGYEQFSPTDDASDAELFEAVFNSIGTHEPHASAVMLPGGRIFGRAFDSDLVHRPLQSVMRIGDDLAIWLPDVGSSRLLPEHARRNMQTFGRGTYERLCQLRVAVVGCSGTGSVVVEQLARLGVGHLVLIDPDVVEYKNLNRIVNATNEDAALARPKVEVLARAVAEMGLGTTVETHALNLVTPRAVRAVSGSDVVFGCMDGAEGRNVLNRVATTYLLPYFDVGVRLDADGHGGIDDIWGTVHYLQPGGSSLHDRGAYSMDDVAAEALRRTDPQQFQRRLREGYIKGVVEDRPAVVSVNTLYAALCVNEFLARLHPFRWDPNTQFAVHRYALARSEIYRDGDVGGSARLRRYIGRGDIVPLLDMSELSE